MNFKPVAILSVVLCRGLSGQQLHEPYVAAKTGSHYMVNYYLGPAPGSHPWWPSWSPDGKWIAFAMQG